jgi:hypothetical protein
MNADDKMAEALEGILSRPTADPKRNTPYAGRWVTITVRPDVLDKGREALAAFKAEPSGDEWKLPEPAASGLGNEYEAFDRHGRSMGPAWENVSYFTADQLRSAYEAGLAARIPAGFWLAPLELSEAMQIAGALAHQRSVCDDFIGPIDDAWTAIRDAHITATEAPAKEMT